MPSIVLVRFATVKAILCGIRSPSSIVTPSSIQRRPGWSGSQALVMFEPFVNFEGSKVADTGLAGSADGLASALADALADTLGEAVGGAKLGSAVPDADALAGAGDAVVGVAVGVVP